MKEFCIYVLLIMCSTALGKSPLCSNRNDRFDNRTGNCLQMYSRCAPNMYFLPTDDVFGECECNSDQSDIAIYWPPTDSCYISNTKGPCEDDQWLVLNAEGKGECQTNPCPGDGRKYIIWPQDGKCYVYGTQGPCVKGNVLFARYRSYYACDNPTIFPVFGLPFASCSPGLNRYGEEKCKANIPSPKLDQLCGKTSKWSSSDGKCVSSLSKVITKIPVRKPFSNWHQMSKRGTSPDRICVRPSTWDPLLKKCVGKIVEHASTFDAPVCEGTSTWDPLFQRCVDNSLRDFVRDDRCHGTSTWDTFLKRCINTNTERTETGVICRGTSTWDAFLKRCVVA